MEKKITLSVLKDDQRSQCIITDRTLHYPRPPNRLSSLHHQLVVSTQTVSASLAPTLRPSSLHHLRHAHQKAFATGAPCFETNKGPNNGDVRLELPAQSVAFSVPTMGHLHRHDYHIHAAHC